MKLIYLSFLQAQPTEADTLIEMLQEESSMSFFEILSQGGILMIPLFALSILAIYVIAERWRTLENSKMDIPTMLNNIESLLKSGSQRRAIQYCEEFDKPLARILKVGISRLGRPIQSIEDAIGNAGKKRNFLARKTDELAGNHCRCSSADWVYRNRNRYDSGIHGYTVTAGKCKSERPGRRYMGGIDYNCHRIDCGYYCIRIL